MTSDPEIMAMKLRPVDPVVTYSSFDNEMSTFRKVVGGYVEPLSLGNGVVILMNEDGKIMGLPSNPLASLVAFVATGKLHRIVGDVLLVGMDTDGFCDMPIEGFDLVHQALATVENLTNQGG